MKIQELIMLEEEDELVLVDPGQPMSSKFSYSLGELTAGMHELGEYTAPQSCTDMELFSGVPTEDGKLLVLETGMPEIPEYLRVIQLSFGLFDWKLQQAEKKQTQDDKSDSKKKEEPKHTPTTRKADKSEKQLKKKYGNKYPKKTYKVFDPAKEYRILLRDIDEKNKSFPNTRKGRVDANMAALNLFKRYIVDLKENQSDKRYKQQTDEDTRKKHKEFMEDLKVPLKKLEALTKDGEKQLKKDKKSGKAKDDTPEKWKGNPDKDGSRILQDYQPQKEEGQKADKNEKSDRPPFNALEVLGEFLEHLKHREDRNREEEPTPSEKKGGKKSGKKSKTKEEKQKKKKEAKNKKSKEDREKMLEFIRHLDWEIKHNPSPDPKTQKANEGLLRDLKIQFNYPEGKKGKKGGEKGGDEKKGGGDDKKKGEGQGGGGGGGGAGKKGQGQKKKGKGSEKRSHHKRRKGGDEKRSHHKRRKGKGGDEKRSHHKRRKGKGDDEKRSRHKRRKGKGGQAAASRRHRRRYKKPGKTDKLPQRLDDILDFIERSRKDKKTKFTKTRDRLVKKLKALVAGISNDHKKAKIDHSDRVNRKESVRISRLENRMNKIAQQKKKTREYIRHRRKVKRIVRRLKKIHEKAVAKGK